MTRPSSSSSIWREVEIWGAESRADLAWDNGFGATVAISFAEGDVRSRTASARRSKASSLGASSRAFRYNAPSGRWGGEADRHVFEQEGRAATPARRSFRTGSRSSTRPPIGTSPTPPRCASASSTSRTRNTGGGMTCVACRRRSMPTRSRARTFPLRSLTGSEEDQR